MVQDSRPRHGWPRHWPRRSRVSVALAMVHTAGQLTPSPASCIMGCTCRQRMQADCPICWLLPRQTAAAFAAVSGPVSTHASGMTATAPLLGQCGSAMPPLSPLLHCAVAGCGCAASSRGQDCPRRCWPGCGTLQTAPGQVGTHADQLTICLSCIAAPIQAPGQQT